MAEIPMRPLRELIAMAIFRAWTDSGNPMVPTEIQWDKQPATLQTSFFRMADAVLELLQRLRQIVKEREEV